MVVLAVVSRSRDIRGAAAAVAGAWTFNAIAFYGAPSLTMAAYALSDLALLLYFAWQITRRDQTKPSLMWAMLVLIVIMLGWSALGNVITSDYVVSFVSNRIFDLEVLVVTAFAGLAVLMRRRAGLKDAMHAIVDRITPKFDEDEFDPIEDLQDRWRAMGESPAPKDEEIDAEDRRPTR